MFIYQQLWYLLEQWDKKYPMSNGGRHGVLLTAIKNLTFFSYLWQDLQPARSISENKCNLY